ncbi:MAG: hydroxysqualene dehydroxylase HpnE [Thermoguttaceae bacterium]
MFTSSAYTSGLTDSMRPRIAVIGGGLSGVAAAETAARAGCRVTLFERSSVLGGRAASLFDPISNEWIDNGIHVTLGCCNTLLELQQRLGIDSFFDKHRALPFMRDNGDSYRIAPCSFLPATWQWFPTFLMFPFLSFWDRIKTGKLINKLGKRTFSAENDVNFSSAHSSFAAWLNDENVSEKARDYFWLPLILSTLSETPENVSLGAVQKVVRDGFLSHRDAMTMYIPKLPLRDIYHEPIQKVLTSLGVEVRTLTRVCRLHENIDIKNETTTQQRRIGSLEQTTAGAAPKCESFDHFILAVPIVRTWEILHQSGFSDFAERLGSDRFEPGAITTVHLWFDRNLLSPNLSHTVLLGSPGQFLVRRDSSYCGQNCENTSSDELSKQKSHYHAVVISASHRLLSEAELTAAKSDILVKRVLTQLEKTFPKQFSEATLIHQRVTTHFDAVFSPSHPLFFDRPSLNTPFSNLTLAGDWTQTDWPATLEGAVISGIKAAQNVIKTK